MNLQEEERQEFEAITAGLKAYSTWHATDTIQSCREACGGQGYLAQNRLAAIKADSDIFTTFEGDNTVLLQLLAKSMLSDYKQQFSSISLFGVMRYVAKQASTAVTELNPVVVRMTDQEHLRSLEFQLNAMRWRERRLLGSVARRLKSRLDNGQNSFQALLETQDHLVKMASAHVEKVILEQFANAIEKCEQEHPSLLPVLNQLCSLYALSKIEKDSGWFLEKGYIESGKSQAIRHQVNLLCNELRPNATALVDAFGIPDKILGAPIAT